MNLKTRKQKHYALSCWYQYITFVSFWMARRKDDQIHNGKNIVKNYILFKILLLRRMDIRISLKAPS